MNTPLAPPSATHSTSDKADIVKGALAAHEAGAYVPVTTLRDNLCPAASLLTSLDLNPSTLNLLALITPLLHIARYLASTADLDVQGILRATSVGVPTGGISKISPTGISSHVIPSRNIEAPAPTSRDPPTSYRESIDTFIAAWTPFINSKGQTNPSTQTDWHILHILLQIALGKLQHKVCFMTFIMSGTGSTVSQSWASFPLTNSPKGSTIYSYSMHLYNHYETLITRSKLNLFKTPRPPKGPALEIMGRLYSLNSKESAIAALTAHISTINASTITSAASPTSTLNVSGASSPSSMSLSPSPSTAAPAPGAGAATRLASDTAAPATGSDARAAARPSHPPPGLPPSPSPAPPAPAALQSATPSRAASAAATGAEAARRAASLPPRPSRPATPEPAPRAPLPSGAPSGDAEGEATAPQAPTPALRRSSRAPSAAPSPAQTPSSRPQRAASRGARLALEAEKENEESP